jgi:hypothetical protein
MNESIILEQPQIIIVSPASSSDDHDGPHADNRRSEKQKTELSIIKQSQHNHHYLYQAPQHSPCLVSGQLMNLHLMILHLMTPAYPALPLRIRGKTTTETNGLNSVMIPVRSSLT